MKQYQTPYRFDHICYAAVLALALWFPQPTAAQAGNQQTNLVSEGARVYGNMCGRCHNPRSPLEMSDRSWTMITNHMRIRANLTGKQMRGVLAFLQASNTDPRERVNPLNLPIPPVTVDVTRGDTTLSSDPEVIDRGQTIVAQRACLGCHVVDGQGGNVGPSLDNVIRRRGAAFVIHKLADPTFNNSTSMMPNFDLTEAQIRAVASYLATLRE
jgi:mono/diheme cytochrome c family protein